MQWLAKLETAREDAAAAIKQLERMETELDRRLSVAEEDLAALATDVSKTAKTVPWLTSEIDAVKRSVRPCSTKPSPSCHSAWKRAKLRCGPSVMRCRAIRAVADAQVHEVGERASKVQIDLAAAEQLLRARISEVGSQLGLEAAQWKETQKDTSGRLSRHDGKLEELERRVSASKVELAQLDERVEPLPAAQAALAAQLAAARAESTQACGALGKRVDQEAELSASGVRKATDELKRADSAIRELQGAAKQVEQQQAQLGARVGEVGAEIEPMKRSLASLGKAVEASDERSAKAAQATAAQIDALQVRPPCVCALALQGGRTHGMHASSGGWHKPNSDVSGVRFLQAKLDEETRRATESRAALVQACGSYPPAEAPLRVWGTDPEAPHGAGMVCSGWSRTRAVFSTSTGS